MIHDTHSSSPVFASWICDVDVHACAKCQDSPHLKIIPNNPSKQSIHSSIHPSIPFTYLELRHVDTQHISKRSKEFYSWQMRDLWLDWYSPLGVLRRLNRCRAPMQTTSVWDPCFLRHVRIYILEVSCLVFHEFDVWKPIMNSWCRWEKQNMRYI